MRKTRQQEKNKSPKPYKYGMPGYLIEFMTLR